MALMAKSPMGKKLTPKKTLKSKVSLVIER